jgi:hypothetical protein
MLMGVDQKHSGRISFLEVIQALVAERSCAYLGLFAMKRHETGPLVSVRSSLPVVSFPVSTRLNLPYEPNNSCISKRRLLCLWAGYVTLLTIIG